MGQHALYILNGQIEVTARLTTAHKQDTYYVMLLISVHPRPEKANQMPLDN